MEFDYSYLDQSTNRQADKQWRLINKLVLAIVCGSVIVAIYLANHGLISSSSIDQVGSSIEKLTIFFVVFFGVTVPIVNYYLGNKRKRKIAKFALSNGLTQISEAKAFDKLPTALKAATSGTTQHRYGYKGGRGFNFDLFEYDYTAIGGKKDLVATICTFETKHKLPHIFLDAHKNGIMHRYGEDQKISLEGDFGKYYDVFAPGMANIEMRQLITPDVMQTLINSGARYDIEIEDNRICVFGTGNLIASDTLPGLLKFADGLEKEFGDESVDWQAVVDVVGNRVEGAGATQLDNSTYLYKVLIITLLWIALAYGFGFIVSGFLTG